MKSKSSVQSYPQLNCYWDIHVGSIKLSAYEVTGLKETLDWVSYRTGGERGGGFKSKITPNQSQETKITIKWGVYSEGDGGSHIFHLWRDREDFFAEHHGVDVMITLLDENREPVLYWICRECTPSDYTGPDLKGGSAEIALQTMTISTVSVKSYYYRTNEGQGYHAKLKKQKAKY